MGKIDFEADSAPFSGNVLPTIEDVAALVETDGKIEISAPERVGEANANKVQAMLLPLLIGLGSIILIGASFLGLSKQKAENPPRGQETTAEAKTKLPRLPEVPFSTGKDIRIIDRKPTPETIDYIVRMGAAGYKLILVYSKGVYTPDPRLQNTPGISLYPVEGNALPADGVLIDGIKWYPIEP